MENILVFIPQNVNLKNVTDSNVSQIVYSNDGFFSLRGRNRSGFWAISKKCYHLLEINFHR